MLSVAENRLLTETGPRTLTGDLFRRYWLPALQSDEIPDADGTPARVQILGEDLVAFRDTSGRVGLLNGSCAHRGASLVLGRNEEGGLRCLYHGWKYDTDGRCMETPAEPPQSTFKDKVRMTAYPVHEAGGVIWAYMGPREKQPPFPDFLWTRLPESHRTANKVLEECNYFQGVEGGVDGIHSSYLHRGLTEEFSAWGLARSSALKAVGSEHLEIDLTTYGYRIGAIQEAGEGQRVRVTQFVMPCFTYVPEQRHGNILFHAWVPRDDESCWTWDIWFNVENELDAAEHLDRRGMYVDANFRKARNKDNNWQQDREIMRTKSYSGIYGIMAQDHAIQESMGLTADRSIEQLATTDLGVIALRRVLLDSLSVLSEGQDPPSLAPGLRLDRLCSENIEIPAGQTWREASPLAPGFAVSPTGGGPSAP